VVKCGPLLVFDDQDDVAVVTLPSQPQGLNPALTDGKWRLEGFASQELEERRRYKPP